MKIKSLLSVVPIVLMLALPFGNVLADEEYDLNSTNFPTSSFLTAAQALDSDGNGKLSTSEIAACKNLSMYLEGDNGILDKFTSLTKLEIHAYRSKVINIDLTNFPKLQTLYLDGANGRFAQIDLTKCKSLKTFSISGYNGDSLNLNNCTKLEEITLGNNVNLGSVSLAKNTALKKLLVYNANLESVDLSNNTNLEELYIGLKSGTLDLSNNTALKKLTVSGYNIKDLDVSNLTALTYLNYHSPNRNYVYDLSSHTELVELHLSNASLKTDFTKLTALKVLELSDCKLENNAIDLSTMSGLTSLDLSGTALSGLDVTNNSALTDLNCMSCGLSSINLKSNKKLETLMLSRNALGSIDLSKNKSLTSLELEYNAKTISKANLTSNTALTELAITDVKEVDIGNCPNLTNVSIKEAQTVNFGSCPALRTATVIDGSVTTLDLSSCQLLVNAVKNFEPTSDDKYFTVSGKIGSNTVTLKYDKAIKIDIDGLCIDEISFPDPNFRAYVKETIDKDKNGKLSQNEIDNVTNMDCSQRSIADLKGVEFFANLKTLDCSDNALTAIDLSALSKLGKLDCSKNQISDPDKLVIGKTALTELNCSNNQLKGLPALPSALTVLNASYNQITSFDTIKVKRADVSHNSAKTVYIGETVEYLDCSYNAITAFNTSNTSKYALKEFHCDNNKLQKIMLDDLSNLEYCSAQNNGTVFVLFSRKMSDVYHSSAEKTIDGVACTVFDDRFVFDSGAEFRIFWPLTAEFFPDAGLRKALAAIDKDKDGYIGYGESYIVEEFKLSNKGIKDITGLEQLYIIPSAAIDLSFNELSELDMSSCNFRYVTCFGNPKLTSITIPEALKEYAPVISTKKGTFDVGGKSVDLTYDEYEFNNNWIYRVDHGVRVVTDPATVTVTCPAGGGTVTGAGTYNKGSEVVLTFTPASGVKFGGWLENGKVVSDDLTYRFTISADRALTLSVTIPQNISFKNPEVKKTLGDADFILAVSGAHTSVTYSSSDTKVAKIDPKSGKVSLVGIGSCVITAEATADNTYLKASATCKLIVSAKPTATPGVTARPSVTPTVAPSDDPKAQILAFVERIYIYVLDREPEAEGAAFWSDELYSFRRTGAEVAQGFIFSPEFEGRGTSDEEFVTILYRTFFGREPEAEGLAFWLTQLSSGTMDRVTVANGFIYSQEWADTCASYGIRSGGDLKPSGAIEPTALTYAFVERMYTTAMGRGYDEEGRQYWASLLANFDTTGENVGAFFFLSDEMTGYNLSDSDYLSRLYLTFMDREPDADGAAYWLGVMASGTSRTDVVLGFTRSPEFTDKCIEARILPY